MVYIIYIKSIHLISYIIKMIESPLFSSFGQKYYGVCNLKGQSIKTATGVNQYQQL